MLLVQSINSFPKVVVSKFQYIICCWFNNLSSSYLDTLFSFNTLYVVGSNSSIAISLSSILFQYIICCWFNSINPKIDTNWQVSIHYMLLVQVFYNCKTILFKLCFNTLYVVGSIFIGQYVIISKFGFNTLYVVGSKSADE